MRMILKSLVVMVAWCFVSSSGRTGAQCPELAIQNTIIVPPITRDTAKTIEEMEIAIRLEDLEEKAKMLERSIKDYSKRVVVYDTTIVFIEAKCKADTVKPKSVKFIKRVKKNISNIFKRKEK